MYLPIINNLLLDFESNANLLKAQQMKAYMRDKFEFFGLPQTVRKTIVPNYLKQLLNLKENNFNEIIVTLWNHPCREVQYVAMEYAYKAKKLWTKNDLSLFEWMIETNSWWDTVDFVASNLIGTFFIKYPELMLPAIKRWNYSDNLWLHRVTIIFQLKYGSNTHKELLFKQCKKYANDQDFFIRKAIGWSLRQYGKFEPEEVRLFIKSNKFSPLSVKEASKYI